MTPTEREQLRGACERLAAWIGGTERSSDRTDLTDEQARCEQPHVIISRTDDGTETPSKEEVMAWYQDHLAEHHDAYHLALAAMYHFQWFGPFHRSFQDDVPDELVRWAQEAMPLKSKAERG